MYKSVESLRIIAALLVFFAHFPINIDVPGISLFISGNNLSGAIGVDIFFIISGFVIYIAASKYVDYNFSSACSFIIQRLFRIFPLYLLVTTLYIILSGKDYSAVTILKSMLLIPFKSPDGLFIDPIVTLGWTLRYELFFYVLVSIGILVNRIITVPVALLVLAIVYGQVNGFYFGQNIVIEFIIGYFIGLLTTKKTIKLNSKFLSLCLIISSVFLCFLVMLGKDVGFNEHSVPRMLISFEHGTYSRWIVWGIPSALLVISCILSENKFKWLLARYGKYTYSVYLWSVFVVALSRVVYDKVSLNNNLIFFASCIILAAISYISFKFIERPTIFLGKRISN